MAKSIKIILLPLLILAALSLLAIPGCGEKETPAATTASAAPTTATTAPATTPAAPATVTTKTTAATAPGQPELQQVLTNSVAAMKKVSTYRFVMNMGIKMDITGGSEAGKMNMTSTIGGDINQTTREMIMVMNMSLNMNTKTAAPVSQNLSLQMYVLADKLYLNMDMPPLGKQWLKMPFSEQLKEAYNLNAVEQQLAPLESVKDLKFLRYETFDGSDCYVLTVTPDMQKILSWVGKDLPAELNTDNLEQISKMFKNLSYTLWIARDSGLIKNMDVAMRLEMSPDQFASGKATDFQNLTMDVMMTMKMFDHNKPVSIVLPPEAKNALEIPAQK